MDSNRFGTVALGINLVDDLIAGKTQDGLKKLLKEAADVSWPACPRQSTVSKQMQPAQTLGLFGHLFAGTYA
jgi:hypothetical protein